MAAARGTDAKSTTKGLKSNVITDEKLLQYDRELVQQIRWLSSFSAGSSCRA